MSKRNQKLRLCAAHMPLIRHSITKFGLDRSTVADAMVTEQMTGVNVMGRMADVRAAYERLGQAPMYFISHDMTMLAVDTALHGGAPAETRLPAETGFVGFEGGIHLDGMPEGIADIGVVSWDNQSKWPYSSKDGLLYFDVTTYANTKAAHDIPLWRNTVGAPDFVAVTPTALHADDMAGLADWTVFWEGVLRAVFALVDVPTVTRAREYKTNPLDRVPRKYDPDLPSNRVRLVDVRENLEAPDGRETPGTDADSGAGKRREYAYRFIVRGFYRQQPYGPGRKLRRRQWIPPFVKGPADKPLRVKDTVNILRGTIRQEGQQEHE